jgi:hypothetical protein
MERRQQDKENTHILMANQFYSKLDSRGQILGQNLGS